MSRLWSWLTAAGRIPAAWRGSCFALLFWRPWGAIAIGAFLAVLATVVSGGSGTVTSSFELYGTLALGIAMTSGTVGRECGTDRHLLLFQRPGSWAGHYQRLWSLAYGCMLVVITLSWSLAAALVADDRNLGVHVLVGSLLFASMAFAVGALATAFVRTGESAIVVLWAILPIIVTVIGSRYVLDPAATAALELPFIPFNAVFELQRALGSGNWAGWHARWGVQLIAFPLVCIALAVVRLRALGRRGID